MESSVHNQYANAVMHDIKHLYYDIQTSIATTTTTTSTSTTTTTTTTTTTSTTTTTTTTITTVLLILLTGDTVHYSNAQVISSLKLVHTLSKLYRRGCRNEQLLSILCSFFSSVLSAYCLRYLVTTWYKLP
jgi:hypothetical protein